MRQAEKKVLTGQMRKLRMGNKTWGTAGRATRENGKKTERCKKWTK